jgi:DNA topoisomerase I
VVAIALKRGKVSIVARARAILRPLRPRVALRDPEVAARIAGLRYVNAGERGIHRERRGRGFRYTGANGKPITDARTLARIRALAIPPAWTAVWICSNASGHVQATGRDARGRKQYRYHPRWRVVRDAAKFDHLVDFSEVLPALRRRVGVDLRRRGLPREKVLAAVVRLLDATSIRVGNEEYARDNQTFGLTTLRHRHASVSGHSIEILFRGKSGKRHRMELTDRRLSRIVRRCQDLPGQKLFKYVTPDGAISEIESGDVNAYLRAVTGREIGSKDFRTWAATVAAALALAGHGEDMTTKAAQKRCILEAARAAATLLGNTAAVCRRSYIHPAVFDGFLSGTLCKIFVQPVPEPNGHVGKQPAGLDPDERIVLRFLKNQRDLLTAGALARAA